MESFELSTLLAAPPSRVYSAWLDSEALGAMVGTPSYVEPTNGGKFSTGNGYVQGYILGQRPYQEIVQLWRTADMPSRHSDSLLALLFEPVDGCATRLTVQHSGIPDGLARRYHQAWLEDYLEPMRRYFAEG